MTFALPNDLRALPQDVTLIAVSKQQPDEALQSALDTGQRHFGENRVQEAQRHWAHRRKDYPDLHLHLIGPLQSNKTREAVALFDVIHTVDREKIARALKSEMTAQEKDLPCFIQVNIGNEPQKAGVDPAGLSDFHALCTQEIGLTIIGLMCLPPAGEPALPYFQELKKRGDVLGVTQFSMGMSSDYKEALQAGATFLRVGSALFGARS